MNSPGYPLDLQSVSYSYLERPNRSILWLLERHVLRGASAATILDVGCGCGANARAIRDHHPSARILGVEPDRRAAELAGDACERVFVGTLEEWLTSNAASERIDAVLLSDVLEHIADPVAWLRSMAARQELADATWIISVPNYAVWYNRMRTLLGRFEYAWSGLYDRTHLRFYTRKSVRSMLDYCGFDVVAERATASIVQSAAPLLRRRFDSDVSTGDHLALLNSPAYRVYRRFIEPAEEAFCNLWKGLLGFQIVLVARRRPR
jgi:trans-aconitate methyltransferase